MASDSKSDTLTTRPRRPSRLLLRILPEQEFDARFKFEGRYGCSVTEAPKILQSAKDLNLNVVGVCFHVGSDIRNPEAFISILQQSRTVFDIARTIGFNMKILDIGGGFPGQKNTVRRFKEITEVINKTLLDLFPPEENLEIIAEPGRYIVASAFTLVANIIGKRCYKKPADVDRDGSKLVERYEKIEGNMTTYFLNDSIFGNFLIGRLYRPGSLIHSPNVIKSKADQVYHESKLLGSTLVPGDCINRSVMLPELDVGDWLYYEDMGAYTLSMATIFNGLDATAIKYHCLEQLWYQVYPDCKSDEKSIK